jgi:hypothetical protein
VLPPLTRGEKILRPQDNIYATDGNNIIRFNFPRENMDMRTGYLEMTVTLRSGPFTFRRLAQGAWSCINRIRTVIGSYEDEIQYYNRLESLHWFCSIPLEVNSTIGQDLMGIGTIADRNLAGLAEADYVFPTRIGILQQGILPLKTILTPTNGQNMFIELTLENPLACMETDGANPQITVSNCRWHYHEITSKDGSYEAELSRKILSGETKLGYPSWQVYQNSVINSANDLQIPWRGASLNAILTTLVDGNTLNNPLVNDKFITWVKELSPGPPVCEVFQFQHQINNNWLPQEAIVTSDNAYRAYLQYLNWQGLWDSRGYMKFPASITLDSFNLDQFVIVGDFYSVPRDAWARMHQDFQFTQLSTKNQSLNSILRLELTNPPPPQTVAYHFIGYNCVIAVDSTGKLIKYY